MAVGGILGSAKKAFSPERENAWVDPVNVDPNQRKENDAKKKAAEDKKRQEELLAKTKPINQALDDADKDYLGKQSGYADTYKTNAKTNVDKYLADTKVLSDKSASQSSDATTTYTNTIQPEMKNIMNSAKSEANSAMSLKDAMDPNNSVMKGVRELYDQRATQANKQGMQDFGVLSALGAQAAQGQFGAGPMTSGAMGQIYAQNQGQAGEAVARAHQRASALQDQGMDRSFDQSNQMYEYGQGAKNRYADSVKGIQDSESKYHEGQSKFRDEQAGYAGDKLGVQSGYDSDMYNTDNNTASLGRDAAYASGGRELGMESAYYGGQQQISNNEIAGKNAANDGKIKTAGAVAGYAKSDERSKIGAADISDGELDEFLSAVKPKTFDYKNPSDSGTSGGRRIGFMLQDVQGTKLGKALTRTRSDGTLMYDKDNLNGIILAGLSRQHKKRSA